MKLVERKKISRSNWDLNPEPEIFFPKIFSLSTNFTSLSPTSNTRLVTSYQFFCTYMLQLGISPVESMLTVLFDLLMDQHPTREGLSFVSMESGAPSATLSGPLWMPWSFVGSYH